MGRSLVVGVDIGGTNTDAVVVRNREILNSVKVPTTDDIGSGVIHAIRQLLLGHSREDICRIALGTTQFINALTECSYLCKVAVIRLCGKASLSLPPFMGFPDTLKKVIYGGGYCTEGGFLFDCRIISAVSASDLKRICAEIESNGVRNVVISGLFSPNDAKHEREALNIVKEFFKNQVSVTLSSEVSGLGLLERENASILNEALKPLACRYVYGLNKSFTDEGLKCPLYITANDGTLMSLNKVMEMPVSTFSSGPTNSMRGAMFLSSLKHAIVADVGGTTTDVGVLVDGFPRPASTHLYMHGVRINFQMPDVYSIALGGGSIVVDDVSTGTLNIGPRSVGSKLKQESLVFGGSVLTTTDLAVAEGTLVLGDVQNVAHLSKDVISRGKFRMKQMVEDAIDRVKTSSDEPVLVLVGGGSQLFDESVIKGCCKVIKPKYGEVANALGAALSQVSGIAEEIVPLEAEDREEAVRRITNLAVENCVSNGGIRDGFEVVEKVTDPLSYLPGNVMLIRIKVVSVVDETRDNFSSTLITLESFAALSDDQLHGSVVDDVPQAESLATFVSSEKLIDSNGDWLLTPFDIDCISVGAGIMGCGGGGSTHLNVLYVKELLRNGNSIKIRALESFENNPTSVLGLPIGLMGAPDVGFEQLISSEDVECFKTMAFFSKCTESEISSQIEKHQLSCVENDNFSYIEDFSKVVAENEKEIGSAFTDCEGKCAVVCVEIGGGNSLIPLAVASSLNLPVVDCDLMGRAFPELQMVSTFMHGLECSPNVLCSFDGRKTVVTKCKRPKDLEDILRKVVVEMGCIASLAIPPVKLENLRKVAILGTYTECHTIGYGILQARRQNLDPIEALRSVREDMKVLIRGKIVDVVKKTQDGFIKGQFVVESFTANEDSENELERHVERVTIEFQNEYLIAFGSDCSQPLATVPNLISVIDLETAEAVMTPQLKYGLRVCVIVLKANSILLTDSAMQVVGPRAFGYSCDFIPLN